MAFAIERPATAFSQPRQRHPRKQAVNHLAFLRTLPCAIPGCSKRDIHAAHIRSACPEFGKRATGAAEKPDDAWALPLCGDHHVFAENAQHTQHELTFWLTHSINPFTLALALWRVSGDEETAVMILRRAGP